MLLKKFWLIGLVLSLGISAFLMAGCSKAPQKELEDASAAVEMARSAEADIYAPELFGKAESNLAQAESLSLAKQYRQARELALSVKIEADTATSLATANKEAKRKEVESLIAICHRMVDELQKLVAEAEKKVPGAKMNAVKNNSQASMQLLDQAKISYQDEDFKNAYDQAKMTFTKVNETKNELTVLLAKKPQVKTTKKG
ncbi:MAG: hypothetical protein AMJ90_09495 [candidate division Zixibacteria bacterium SM23_73_2]|nr:MAG: hypothetical protein AMJ90_09495 [candidate division Zixibacteria bacterium SM23_73_2]ODS38551.1 MAG: hypothetical protein A7315_12225 [Candidatus Altiarchaeales archaeon WOR_SM1_79]